MSDKSKNSTNKDILSGKGLKPIVTLQPTPKQPGITTENRRNNPSGVRVDRFSKIPEKKGGR